MLRVGLVESTETVEEQAKELVLNSRTMLGAEWLRMGREGESVRRENYLRDY